MPVCGGDGGPKNCCKECAPECFDATLARVEGSMWYNMATPPLDQREHDIIIAKLRDADIIRELVAHFRNANSGVRKTCSWSGSLLVVHLQLVLLKPKHLEQADGKWITNAEEGMEIFKQGKEIYYVPTNDIWQQMWTCLWGEEQGLGDLEYNKVTIGDTLEALTTLYKGRKSQGQLPRGLVAALLELPVSGASIKWFRDEGMLLLSKLGGFFVWENYMAPYLPGESHLPAELHVPVAMESSLMSMD